MTNRRQLIRGASCLAVALSFAVALPITESKAQPLGPSLSQMQSQAQVPAYEKAQMRRGPDRDRRRGRRGWRGGGGGRPGFSFGFGPRKHCWWGPRGRQCKWW
jgi:hypothetical protein